MPAGAKHNSAGDCYQSDVNPPPTEAVWLLPGPQATPHRPGPQAAPLASAAGLGRGGGRRPAGPQAGDRRRNGGGDARGGVQVALVQAGLHRRSHALRDLPGVGAEDVEPDHPHVVGGVAHELHVAGAAAALDLPLQRHGVGLEHLHEERGGRCLDRGGGGLNCSGGEGGGGGGVDDA